MAKPWDPDPETVTTIRRRLLRGESVREVAADYPVYRSTVGAHARGDVATPEADIGPVRSLGQGISLWVRVDREVVGDD